MLLSYSPPFKRALAPYLRLCQAFTVTPKALSPQSQIHSNSSIINIQEMFYQNGRLLQEPEYNPRTTKWVNVFFNMHDYRCDDLTIMRTVLTCIRTRVVSITGHAMHHDVPLCISIQVPGEHVDKESILAAAEVSAECLRAQVARGSVHINRSLLFRGR